MRMSCLIYLSNSSCYVLRGIDFFSLGDPPHQVLVHLGGLSRPLITYRYLVPGSTVARKCKGRWCIQVHIVNT